MDLFPVNLGIPKLVEDVPGKPEDEFGDVSHLLGKQKFRLAKKPADNKPHKGKHVQGSTQQPQTMKYVFHDLSGKEHWYELVDDAEEPAEQAACAEDAGNADKVCRSLTPCLHLDSFTSTVHWYHTHTVGVRVLLSASDCSAAVMCCDRLYHCNGKIAHGFQLSQADATAQLRKRCIA